MSNGLGRGLGSLIPQRGSAVRTKSPVKSDQEEGLLQVNIEDVSENPLQPRQQFTDYKLDELVDSIKEYGIIQPLLVTKKGDKYELIAGERRLRAARKVGLKQVPVIIREATDRQKLEVALIENIQREELNPVDLGIAYKRLMDDFDLTQEEVAKKVGKARPSVANTLRMLKLPGEIKTALVDGQITEGHAKYLIGLENENKQMGLFRKIIHNNLTVADTDKEAKNMGGTKAARVKVNYADKDKEFALREFFGTRVEVKRKGKGGEIVINFFSEEELNEIIKKVTK